MTLLPYSLVIATRDRVEDLEKVLECLNQQTVLPDQVVVVDASLDDTTRTLCARAFGFSLHWTRAEVPSAARQRNQGAATVTTPLLGFCDDDITFPPEHFEKLVAPFSDPSVDPEVMGTTGRIEDLGHSRPGRMLHRYYRWQAGYDDPHYGGRLLVLESILTPVTPEPGGDAPIPSEWLNSTCVIYRSEDFLEELFPPFDGYSFLEDVHLSARMAKRGTLWFIPGAVYQHHERPGPAKRNAATLSRMHMRNQRRVAREVMGLGAGTLFIKQLAHRVFISIAIIRQRQKNALARLWGTWTG